jgi:hypothetical protein
MVERSRKRSLIDMPGEGSGVPGVDPLVYREPGDDPEVDELIAKLREGAQGKQQAANSQGAERVKKPRATRGRSGESARDRGAPKSERTKSEGTAIPGAQGGEEAQGGRQASGRVEPKVNDGVKLHVNPLWLTFALIAILAPVIVLLLVLLLSRTQTPAEGAREATPKEAQKAPSASPVALTAPSAAPGATADVVPAAPATTAAPSAAVSPSVAVSPSAPPTSSGPGTPKAPKGAASEGGPGYTPAVRTLKPKVHKTPEF